MKLGMQVGLGPDHIVLDGTQVPSPNKNASVRCKTKSSKIYREFCYPECSDSAWQSAGSKIPDLLLLPSEYTNKSVHAQCMNCTE